MTSRWLIGSSLLIFRRLAASLSALMTFCAIVCTSTFPLNIASKRYVMEPSVAAQMRSGRGRSAIVLGSILSLGLWDFRQVFYFETLFLDFLTRSLAV